MTSPIKAILFDFGRVLCLFDRIKSAIRLLEYSTLEITPEALDDELFALDGLGTLFERGEFRREEFFTLMKKRYQLSSTLSLDEFAEMWGRIFTEVPGVKTLIATLPAELRLGVLSNLDPIHWSMAKQLDVIQRFDADLVTKSFEQKTRKPDPQMYKHAQEVLNVPVESILYLDDIQDFVDVAKSLGLQAERFDARSMTYEDMKRIFISYGILS